MTTTDQLLVSIVGLAVLFKGALWIVRARTVCFLEARLARRHFMEAAYNIISNRSLNSDQIDMVQHMLKVISTPKLSWLVAKVIITSFFRSRKSAKLIQTLPKGLEMEYINLFTNMITVLALRRPFIPAVVLLIWYQILKRRARGFTVVTKVEAIGDAIQSVEELLHERIAEAA